jgi:hypothetical protein
MAAILLVSTSVMQKRLTSKTVAQIANGELRSRAVAGVRLSQKYTIPIRERPIGIFAQTALIEMVGLLQPFAGRPEAE